jgi:hypothetical protein
MVELKRTEGIIRKIDKFTDNIADQSHNKISAFLGTLGNALKGPIDKIKSFLKE